MSRGRWYLNIFVVWFLTGFWHGAAWNFIAWGLGYAVLLVIEKAGLLRWLEKHKIWSHIYVLLVVAVGFVVFNAANMEQALGDISAMFGMGGVPLVSVEALYYLRSYLVVFVIAVIGATPLPKLAVERMQKCIEEYESKGSIKHCDDVAEKAMHAGGGWLGRFAGIVADMTEASVLLVLLLVVTAYLVDGSFNPFLYFRF